MTKKKRIKKTNNGRDYTTQKTKDKDSGINV